MSRRGESFRIKLAHLERPHKVNKAHFQIYAQRGLISIDVYDPRLGRVARGNVGFLDTDGQIQFIRLESVVGPSIPSSWEWVERALLKGLVGGNLSQEQLEANIRAEFCVT